MVEHTRCDAQASESLRGRLRLLLGAALLLLTHVATFPALLVPSPQLIYVFSLSLTLWAAAVRLPRLTHHPVEFKCTVSLAAGPGSKQTSGHRAVPATQPLQ